MVRLGIVANTKTIVPAIILKKFPVDKPPTFEILAMGESWVVTVSYTHSEPTRPY